jgi:hypothetical protein
MTRGTDMETKMAVNVAAIAQLKGNIHIITMSAAKEIRMTITKVNIISKTFFMVNIVASPM